MTDPVRLSKRLAELLPCSRREAELYIEGGWITVDGKRVEEPQYRVTDQRIELLPGATPTTIEPVTLLLHKPVDIAEAGTLRLLDPAHLWAEDRSGLRPLRKHFARLQATIPLETGASGLLVFTQSHGVLRKLIEDAAQIEHEYVVEVSGNLAENGLRRLCHGLVWQGRPLPPLKVSWQSENRLRFAGKQFRPGQIAYMCQAVGLQVLAIRRIRLGGVSMAKLPVGEWRYLLPNERF
ncbi:rRNA pseudouridine synthase [Pseudomonas jinjuensis]|uniref:Dual-specificity RNA pseudouridine synthase RluF n=1 Tax=Pseudomonas jinjuensis TaxID=198616 RepID=A0A1H0HYB7_9PSED|nr:rRNA pseudouridine synthase [Pseudomonas jinjuensis]SDO24218.1 23S rRNA pseudouridine2604 synthase [Pseudomonas jinjuensis]